MPSRINSDNLAGATRYMQVVGMTVAPAMGFDRLAKAARKSSEMVRDLIAKTKAARDCTPDEIAAMREGMKRCDERQAFDESITEAKRLGAEARSLGKSIYANPYDDTLFPLQFEAWADGWHDEGQRRLTETDR